MSIRPLLINLLKSVLLAIPCLCVSACDFTLTQANVKEFLDNGVSLVSVRASYFSSASSLGRIPSGTAITGTLTMLNPSQLDITYSLSQSTEASYFSSQPEAAPVATDLNHVSFSFELSAEAEHKTITFALGKYAASINRTYANETISVLCDSPPDPAHRVATIMDANQKSVLAILLPTGAIDDDLTKVKITWGREDSSTTSSATYSISELASASSSNPFSSSYDCYFQSSDCVAGYGYAYSVTIIDEAGQESSAAETSSSANVFYLNYDGNGNTAGAVPDSVGYRYNASATVSADNGLVNGNYSFTRWNTKADGSGTSYNPGDSLTIPAGETTLYAQWSGSSDISVSVPSTDYTGMGFSSTSFSVTQGQAFSLTTNNPTLAAISSDWIWYVDGVQRANITGPTFTLSSEETSSMLGTYQVAASVVYNGISYSGRFSLTATRRLALNINALTVSSTSLVGSAGASGNSDGFGADASFTDLTTIATDGSCLYVADYGANLIRKIDLSTNYASTIATGFSGFTNGLTLVGRILYITTSTGYIYSLSVDTKDLTIFLNTGLGNIAGITTDGTYLYAAAQAENQIIKINIATSAFTTLAGSGTPGSIDGTGTSASFNVPWGITTDGTYLFVSDSTTHKIRKVTISSGEVTTLNSDTVAVQPAGLAIDGPYLYAASREQKQIWVLSPNSGISLESIDLGTLRPRSMVFIATTLYVVCDNSIYTVN
jgi:hypothetical protein